MTYRAQGLARPTYRVSPSLNTDYLLIAINHVLRDENVFLRNKYPELFMEVDSILSDPNHIGHPHEVSLAHEDRWEMRECPWCGELFAIYKSAKKVHCDMDCAMNARRWNSKRSA